MYILAGSVYAENSTSLAQVAESLVISPRTVNAHLRSTYSKLGLTEAEIATLRALGDVEGEA